MNIVPSLVERHPDPRRAVTDDVRGGNTGLDVSVMCVDTLAAGMRMSEQAWTGAGECIMPITTSEQWLLVDTSLAININIMEVICFLKQILISKSILRNVKNESVDMDV